LEFADHFSTPAFYERNIDAAMYVSEMAGDITDRLRACGRYEREIAPSPGSAARPPARRTRSRIKPPTRPLRQY